MSRNVLVGLCALAMSACSPEHRPPSIVLVAIDTARADAFGAYGGRASTAAFDALAKEGMLFSRALTPTPITHLAGVDEAELVVSFLRPRIELERALEARDRFVQLALTCERCTDAGLCVLAPRVDLQHASIARDRLVQLALRREGQSYVQDPVRVRGLLRDQQSSEVLCVRGSIRPS